ncbi:MAG: VWA domain-containing protein [Myxococcota bacterium]
MSTSDDASRGDGPGDERLRRWRLALGTRESGAGGLDGLLDAEDLRRDQALAALYGEVDLDRPPEEKPQMKDRMKVGRGRSRPVAARWLDDVRELFPKPVVHVIQKDAFERLNLKSLLTDPEFLETVEPDVNLVATLVSLRSVIPAKAKAAARQVVRKVVDDLMRRLEHKVQDAVRGARNRTHRTRRPRFDDIDWPRTLQANLRHYQPEHRTVVPETLVGFGRKKKRSELDEVILCVDQSGSMMTSVVYASIFSAVLASIPSLSTKLVVYDTEVVDLSEDLADPVEVIFGVQLGGGNDTPKALAYCEQILAQPSQTHFVLISDLFEGDLSADMLARLQRLVDNGVNLIVLLALNDDGRAGYDEENARAIAAMGAPVFACTPEQFPELIASALKREDLHAWAAQSDIALVRGEKEEPPR